MTINKLVAPVALGAVVCMAIANAVSQTLTPEAEAKSRRLLRDRMFQLYHSEWRAGLQPVGSPQTVIYPNTLTPEREATARQMLRQKMAELYAQEGVSSPMMAHTAPTGTASYAPAGTLTPPLEAQARQMVRARMAELYAQDVKPQPQMAATIRPNSEALYPMPASTDFAASTGNTPLDRLKRYYVTGQIGPREYYREAGRLTAQK